MPVQVNQDIRRKRVQVALPLRIFVEDLAQPPVAEIGEQKQALVHVAREDLRGAEPHRRQPFGDCDERPRVLVRRRRIHQHRGAVALDHTEVAAERRIARKRQDLRSRPPARGKEFMRIRRRNHRGGHRPSHDGGTFAVKRRAPASRKVEGQLKRVGPGAFTGPLRPLDQEHRIRRGIEAQLIEFRRHPRSGKDRRATRGDRRPHMAGRSRSSGSAPRPDDPARPESLAPGPSSRRRAALKA